MEFDPNNKVVQLCAEGMEMEGRGQLAEAGELFNEAWSVAATDFEKFTATHYVAHDQDSISNKLKWDETALKHALNIDGESVKEDLPSLYLNIGKCYEDLNDPEQAKLHYELAYSYSKYLPGNGYGNMIKSGIIKGLRSVKYDLKTF